MVHCRSITLSSYSRPSLPVIPLKVPDLMPLGKFTLVKTLLHKLQSSLTNHTPDVASVSHIDTFLDTPIEEFVTDFQVRFARTTYSIDH